MCCRFAFESAHMLCEFCKTFQQMPFKTFTQGKQTMSPRRSCSKPAFCCSAAAQQSSSPMSEPCLLPQPCPAQPFEGSDAKAPTLTQVLTKGPSLEVLLTFWSLLCQGSGLPGHAGVTLTGQAEKLMCAESKCRRRVFRVCVFSLLFARVTSTVINSALHFS